MPSGGDQSSQNRSYRRNLSNIRCLACVEIGHYASFNDKQASPPVVAHAEPVYASGALAVNVASVLEDYYGPATEDNTISALATVKEGAQKAGRKSKAGANVPSLQQAVDQGILDDDEELTPVEDMNELEDIPVPTEIQHVAPSVERYDRKIA